jgi:hypothetical protein
MGIDRGLDKVKNEANSVRNEARCGGLEGGGNAGRNWTPRSTERAGSGSGSGFGSGSGSGLRLGLRLRALAGAARAGVVTRTPLDSAAGRLHGPPAPPRTAAPPPRGEACSPLLPPLAAGRRAKRATKLPRVFSLAERETYSARGGSEFPTRRAGGSSPDLVAVFWLIPGRFLAGSGCEEGPWHGVGYRDQNETVFGVRSLI